MQGLQGNVPKSVFVLLMKLIGFYVLVAVAVVVANLPPPPPPLILFRHPSPVDVFLNSGIELP